MFFAILFLILAYIIGSFPSALVVGKLTKGIDIRDYGSHNLGSTNAIRVLGKKIGFVVFFLDVLKGALVVALARILFELCGFKFDGNDIHAFNFVLFEPLFYGLCAVIGHMFPIFAGFRGGKAVATSLGITFVFAPIPAVLCLIVFLIILKTTGYVSVSSTCAILTVCLTASLQYFLFQEHLNIELTGHLFIGVVFFFYVISLMMIIKHLKNYIRLAKGTENSFKKKKENTSIENNNEEITNEEKASE